MQESDFNAAIVEWETRGRTFYSNPCTDANAIRRCAEALALDLPDPILRLFERFDAFGFASDEFISVDTLVVETRSTRVNRRNIPSHWIPFLRDLSGGWYYVVCAQAGKHKPADYGCVYENPGEFLQEIDLVATDVWRFLVDRLKEHIKYLT